MVLFKSKLVSCLVILATIFAISSPFWLFQSAEPDNDTLTPAQAHKKQQIEQRRRLQQEMAQQRAEERENKRKGANGVLDLNEVASGTGGGIAGSASSVLADSTHSGLTETGEIAAHTENTGNNAIKSGAIEAVDAQNQQQQSASINKHTLSEGEHVADQAYLSKTNITRKVHPKGGMTIEGSPADSESAGRVQAKLAANANTSASIANVTESSSTLNKISRTIADNIDVELSSDPSLEQPHITDLLSLKDGNSSKHRNNGGTIQVNEGATGKPSAANKTPDKTTATAGAPDKTSQSKTDQSQTGLSKTNQSQTNQFQTDLSQTGDGPQTETGAVAKSSLQEQVDNLVQQQTSSDKEKYQQALNDRYEQVTWAVETIKANSRVYLPENLSSKAVIVFFGVDVNPPSSKHTEVDSLTGATKLALEPEVIYTEHGKEYKSRYTYGSGVKYLANMLHEENGSTLYDIMTVESYPSDSILLYEKAFRQQVSKQRPELTDDQSINFADYDTIYLCYAIWWEDLPMPIYSFLDKYDLSGKTIIPLCLSRRDGFTKTIERIRAAEPNAEISSAWKIRPLELEKLEFRDTLRNWLIKLEQDLNEGELE